LANSKQHAAAAAPSKTDAKKCSVGNNASIMRDPPRRTRRATAPAVGWVPAAAACHAALGVRFQLKATIMTVRRCVWCAPVNSLDITTYPTHPAAPTNTTYYFQAIPRGAVHQHVGYPLELKMARHIARRRRAGTAGKVTADFHRRQY